jgi:hypothetical protein
MGLAGFAMTPAGKALILIGCIIPWVILKEDEWNWWLFLCLWLKEKNIF